MPGIVASNSFLLARAEELRDLLNVGYTLRLFQNDLTPSPEISLGSFIEADFGGYASFPLDDEFSDPEKIQDGEYEIASSIFNFACDGTPDNVIYGMYIDDGSEWVFAYRFPTPLEVEDGATFSLQVKPQDWALSIVEE